MRSVQNGIVAETEEEASVDAQRVIDSIEPRSVSGLRDRAMVALIAYGEVSVAELTRLKVRDYVQSGPRTWVIIGDGKSAQLKEIGTRAGEYIQEYITAACIEDDQFSLLFRSTGDTGHIVYNRRLEENYVRDRIRRLIAKASEKLTTDDTVKLLQSIPRRGLVNRRDRAILGIMAYASASPETIAQLRMNDYCLQADRPRITFSAQVSRDIPQALTALLDDYLTAIPWKIEDRLPLFRGQGTRPITPAQVHQMIQSRRISRSRSAGAPDRVLSNKQTQPH